MGGDRASPHQMPQVQRVFGIRLCVNEAAIAIAVLRAARWYFREGGWRMQRPVVVGRCCDGKEEVTGARRA